MKPFRILAYNPRRCLVGGRKREGKKSNHSEHFFLKDSICTQRQKLTEKIELTIGDLNMVILKIWK